MESTPKSCQTSADSGCYFDSSHSIFEGTPGLENESTPISFNKSRKRKASFVENLPARKLSEVIESCPTSPQFSSTLNESLLNSLEKFHLQHEGMSDFHQKRVINISTNYQNEEIEDNILHISKILKCDSVQKKFYSVPNTPEKQLKCGKTLLKKANTNSFIKNFSHVTVQSQSPLNKEAYNILYPELPPLEQLKKPLTPQKLKDSLSKIATPAKKCLFSSLSRRELFMKIVTNNVIMAKVLRELSDGDLYRLSQVSKTLKESILSNTSASNRYKFYMRVHHTHKENYRITPPSSPEKSTSYVEASPGSKNHLYFYEIACMLNKNQSLTKCPSCDKASVVVNSIAYCQAVNSCGYIFCQKCNSFTYNPMDFKDKCNNIQSRNLLGDLSNSTGDHITDTTNSFFSSSLNLSTSNKYDSSGIFSECENTTPRQNVKRNLSKSFTVPPDAKIKILSSNNNRVASTPPPKIQRRTSLVVPFLPSDNTRKITEIVEPSSPPRIKQYSVGSKQSRKNLKRLTR